MMFTRECLTAPVAKLSFACRFVCSHMTSPCDFDGHVTGAICVLDGGMIVVYNCGEQSPIINGSSPIDAFDQHVF